MNLRKPLFAIALAAVAGSALAAPPSTTPSTSPNAAAASTPAKHKHVKKADTRKTQGKPASAKKG